MGFSHWRRVDPKFDTKAPVNITSLTVNIIDSFPQKAVVSSSFKANTLYKYKL